jgi:hypothetical protein
MNGMCIPNVYFLDGEFDCLDQSDELPFKKTDNGCLDPAVLHVTITSVHTTIGHVAMDNSSPIDFRGKRSRSSVKRTRRLGCGLIPMDDAINTAKSVACIIGDLSL